METLFTPREVLNLLQGEGILTEAGMTDHAKLIKMRKIIEREKLGFRNAEGRWTLNQHDVDRLRHILTSPKIEERNYPYEVADIARLSEKKHLTVRQQAARLDIGHKISGKMRFTEAEAQRLIDYQPEIGSFQIRYRVDGLRVSEIAARLARRYDRWSLGTLEDKIRKQSKAHRIGMKDEDRGVYVFIESDVDRILEVLDRLYQE